VVAVVAMTTTLCVCVCARVRARVRVCTDVWCTRVYPKVSRLAAWSEQMLQLFTTRCSCIAILWVSLVSFAAVTLRVSSQRVFIVNSLSIQSENLWIYLRICSSWLHWYCCSWSASRHIQWRREKNPFPYRDSKRGLSGHSLVIILAELPRLSKYLAGMN
jgi:hypothetical protein